MEEIPRRSGAWGGGSFTRTDFIEIGKEVSVRGEEASRAFTRLVLNTQYLEVTVICSQPVCRLKYCLGRHRIDAESLMMVNRAVLRDLVGRRSVTWRVLELLLARIEAGQVRP